MDIDAQDHIRAQALEWHIRLRDGDDAAWDAFADWMAEDPSHADAYAMVEDTDLAIEPLLAQAHWREVANDDAGTEDEHEASIANRGWRKHWAWGGGALAASLAAMLVFGPGLMSSRYLVETGPGETRTIALDDHSKVILNGSTRLELDRKDSRYAALEDGEALFEVEHDARRPFTLTVGTARIQDVGTVFNVAQVKGATRVAVAEGEVLYGRSGHRTPLRAGQALVDEPEAGGIIVGTAPASAVGGWRSGRFQYAGEPLSRVAADIGRSLGVAIIVDPAIADRPFYGALTLQGTGTDQLQAVAPALDTTLVRSGNSWRLAPMTGAPR